jgi:CRP-like cAMP-binding protein
MTTYECTCERCHLKSLFFKHISKDEIRSICTQKVEHQYEKGDVILQEGDPIHNFLYLKDGLVKLSRTTGGDKEQIISFAMPFDFVSLLSVFSSETYHYTVTAIEDSTTCELDLNQVKEIARDNGVFTLDLMKRVSEATDRIILDNLEIKQKHLPGRVAYVLLFFADKVYNSDDFELPISRKEIAEYIGMTTENVIRSLSEFKKDKIIRIFGKEIDIIDKERLENISLHG